MPNIKSSVLSVKTDAKRHAKNVAEKTRVKKASRKVLDAVNDCYKAGKTWEQCWKKIQDDWAKGARCVPI